MNCDCISDESQKKRCLKEQPMPPRYICMRPKGHGGKHRACHEKNAWDYGVVKWCIFQHLEICQECIAIASNDKRWLNDF